MGGSGTATVDQYKLSEYLKDSGQALAMIAASIGAAALIPEPGMPALAAFAAGVGIGAGIAYAAGMVADSAGH